MEHKFKKVYVCSPLRADTPSLIRDNMIRARLYVSMISELYHCRAIAPHGYMPEFLDEDSAAERQLALEFGLKLLTICDAVIICGEKITQGMFNEIEYAIKHKIPVFKFDAESSLQPIYGLSILMGCDK